MKKIVSVLAISALMFGAGQSMAKSAGYFNPQSMPLTQLSADNIQLQSTSSGLKYKVLKVGSGAKVKASDEVELRFISYDMNGEVHDGTLDNSPIVLPVSMMFSGLKEGLMLMQAGGIYELHIPAHLGYKEEGKGRKKAIIYRVELLKIGR